MAKRATTSGDACAAPERWACCPPITRWTPAPPSLRPIRPISTSSYESESEAEPTDRRKIIILGGGPNRIGQGIEFDYCCCHASFALQELGYETIMVNCNPETVSTDYDTSDRLYFEPLTFEDVLNIVEREQASGELEGVIVQFGGQTPLNLATSLQAAGVPILGTSPDAIDLAEDRDRFGELLERLEIPAPAHGTRATPTKRWPWPSASAIRWWCAPPMCWAGAPWRSWTTRRSLRRYMVEAVTCRWTSRF